MDKYCSMTRRLHAFRKLTDIPFERAAAEAQKLINPEVLFQTQVEAVRTDDVDQTANIRGAIWTANEVSRAI